MSDVIFRREGHAAWITLNRPKALNAITPAMDERLAEIWDEVDADPEIRVAVLKAEGEKAFCAGADISGGAGASRGRLALGGGLTGVGGPLRVLTKPLVVAVHGYALGGGFELAMCADILVAADNTLFGLPEVAAGIIGESGVVHRAIRQLPYRVAMAMILTGERMDASTALQHGLVNAVAAREDLETVTRAWVDRALSVSPLAAQAAKNAVLAGAAQSLETALGTRYEPIEAYATSADVHEGRAAFAERRKPVWAGR